MLRLELAVFSIGLFLLAGCQMQSDSELPPAGSVSARSGSSAISKKITIKEEEEMGQEEETLIQATRQIRQDMIDRNTAGIDAVFADGSSLTHISGRRQPKADWIADMESGEMRYFGAEEESIHAEIMGDRATVVMRQRLDARIYGSRHVWPLQLTFSYEKQAGEWQVVDAVARTY